MRARRRAAIAGACAAALALAGCGAEPEASAPARPDVVIVTWDTARADHVGPDAAVRGLTERWDRLAKDGVRFAHARTPSPMTLPAHASLFTGSNPPRHGARVNTLFALPDAADTLAERLSSQGWRTAAFVSAAVLDARYGLAQGFGHYDGGGGGEEEERGFAARRGDATVDAARAWIAGVPSDEPIFVWVHLFDPHAPWEAPEPWRRRHPDPYSAEIAYVDFQTGRLIDAIAGAGRFERTLLVLTADHGEALGEHGEPTHGYFVYDATLRVPLLLRAGGRTGVSLPRGRRIDAPVLLSDVAPTLLHLLGLPPQPGDGVSLAPLLRGEPAPPRELALESVDPYYVFGAAPAFGVVDAGGEVWIDLPRRERYAPAADPGELRNLYEPSQAAQADALFARHPRAWPPAAPNALADAQLEQQLAALGYLSGRAGAAAADAGASPAARPDPKDLLPVAALWMDQHDVRRPDRALAEADALAQRFGPLPALAFYRADRLDELGRPDRAIELLREASQAHPAEARLREELAERLALRAQDRALAAQIRAVWQQQPDHPAAEHDLAVVLQRLGENDEAMALYRSWLARHPTDVSARIDLSRLLGASGELDDALSVLRAAPAGAARKARLDCEEGRVLLDWLERPDLATPLLRRCQEKGGALGPRESALVADGG